MTTTKPDHPEQLMLPGQAAAPGGPVDMNVMYLMHHAFRRDLDRFSSAVPRTPLDDAATWVALEQRWRKFSEILHHHHRGEDAGIWPFLLERAHPAERQTLFDMEAEHEKIDPLLESCGAAFAELSSPGGTAAAARTREELRASLAVRLAEAKEILGAHLRHEESEAMVILQRHMTAEEWERIEVEHFKAGDSLWFLLYVVPWLAEDLPPQVLADVLDDAGTPMKVVNRLGARLRFRGLERKAFRHLA